MKIVRRCLFSMALALSAGWCLNASAVLSAGDLAPKLQTGKFVQGDPVKDFAPGKAYIVEFWATWCGPCKMAIPHLNEKYIKYKDKGLIVIGQDCWEQDESKVAPFIKTMGDKMTYRVALDDKEGSDKGKMAETWMQAANQNGIPTAFLIDKTGHIAWIGHPMTLKEETIDQVLAGTFDTKAAAEAQAKEKADEEKQGAVMKPIMTKFQTAMKEKDWDAALSSLDELAKVAPEALADQIPVVRFRVLSSKEDYPAAFKVLRAVADAHKDDPQKQNELAWMIVTDKTIKKPDLALAETMAQRAVDGSKDDTAKSQFLDTLARVKFMQGSKADATELQKKAVELAGNDEKASLQKTLDSYQKGELPAAQ